MEQINKTTKVSVCITTYNESLKDFDLFFTSLSKQTLKPDEIIIVDAGQKNINEVIKKYKTIFKQTKIKYIQKKNVSRSKGRNIAIQNSRNEIIAVTDLGCKQHPTWLEEISKPFLKDKKVDVAAGTYNMVYKNGLQKSMSKFLGTSSNDIDNNFLPSARSIAFKKRVWEKVSGFPENLEDTAEDSLFNLNLINAGAKFFVAKKAIVDWYMPDTIFDFSKKIYRYALGDLKSKVWWHSIKKWKTHNIKLLTVFIRYLLFFVLFANNFNIGLFTFLVYLFYSYTKANFWGILLQLISDISIMFAMLTFIFEKTVHLKDN